MFTYIEKVLKNSTFCSILQKQKPENPYRVYNTPEILGDYVDMVGNIVPEAYTYTWSCGGEFHQDNTLPFLWGVFNLKYTPVLLGNLYFISSSSAKSILLKKARNLLPHFDTS